MVESEHVPNDKRRLALFLPDMGGGGAERVALALLEGFLERGHPVDLVLSERKGPLLEMVPKEVEIFDLHAPRQRSTLLPLTRYLRERRPFALHAMMWPLPVVSVMARILAHVDTRIVGGEHVTLSYMPFALRHKVVRAVTRFFYRRADGLTAVSEGVADDVATLIGLPHEYFEVIYNPLLLPAEPVSEDDMRDLWPDRTHRLLAVGELKNQKNFSLLLEAMAILRKRGDISLVILGEGECEEELRQQMNALGLSDCVTFAGFHKDIWRFFNAADLFVLSSDYEGLPTVLIEALHAGLPIVSTDCPSGPDEILEGGIYGELVPLRDPVALARGIEKMLGVDVSPSNQRARAVELSGRNAIERHRNLMLGESYELSHKS
ncbi:glycosyltransferase [Novosphingopyxis sp. YJ-S2-01]|uniref:glycosyltransferase n=1 Tax=Novosphingopyxis sp. YJ-S2-01 TaxID=2794021 RepID=UPI0018DDCD5A|nr:glycosyltransferase [Novosphingopyxis sp. YJ-S2-01]MBH9538457.1 glycosyltransferase [Novosphingopyxis sp. YJ-S2-01]